jgi:hypothetical protein
MNRPRAASGHACARVRARRDVEGGLLVPEATVRSVPRRASVEPDACGSAVVVAHLDSRTRLVSLVRDDTKLVSGGVS